MKTLLIASLMTALLRAPESDPPATGSGPDTAVPDSDAPQATETPDNVLSIDSDAPETTETAPGDAVPDSDAPTDAVPAETTVPDAVERPNAVEDSVLIMGGVSFTFKTAPDLENPFEVQIGETAEETDANLMEAINRAARFAPPETPAAVEAPPEPTDPAERFDREFPAFGPWFDRVQKWAQFNSRPIPEPNATWEADYAAKVRPCDAAEKNCMPQP